jgi:uncharacterized protein (TIGR03118 family)
MARLQGGKMLNRFHSAGRAAVVALAGAGLVAAVPAAAFASTGHGGHYQPRKDQGNVTLHQVNLASDLPGKAPLTDPDLKNPWGISLTPTSALWVSDQGADASTLYSLAPGSSTASKSAAVRVTMADSTLGPSGQVAYTGKGFVLSNGTTKAPAAFMFATLDGHIEAWSPTVDPHIGNAEDKATVAGAGYTGLAEASTRKGDELFAANFAGGTVDVFNSSFHQVKLASWQFRDRRLPQGYNPFGIQALGGHIFVAYDKPDPATGREGVGPGIGAVDEYSTQGQLISRIATGGALNAPWGVAIAPRGWGAATGSLLVGNFGDGHINIFARHGSHFAAKATGEVRDAGTGQPFAEPGLWGLLPGTQTTGGTDALWFAAGINGEQDGLLGVLRP